MERLPRRDRAAVIVGAVGVSAIAWAYLVYVSQDVPGMDPGIGMASANIEPWGAVDFGLMFLMWAVMLVAMMLPTAAPMVVMFTAFNRRRHQVQRPYVPTGVFIFG